MDKDTININPTAELIKKPPDEIRRKKSDLTKYQANFISKLDFNINPEIIERIEDEDRRKALSKYLNRSNELPDVHRTNERRVFSPLTAMPRELRKNITYNGYSLIEIDAANSQPVLLITELINKDYEVEQGIIDILNNGMFYEIFKDGSRTRDQIKESVFSCFYSKQLDSEHPVFKKLKEQFPKFANSFIEYQSTVDSLAEHLQKLESDIWIDKISTNCMKLGIEHATIHDSIVFPRYDNIEKVLSVIENAFNGTRPNLHTETLHGDLINIDNISQDADTPNTYDQLIKEALYNINSEFEQPIPIIKIGENTFGTLGNFSMITGKAKSRKTFLITLLLAFITKTYNLIGLIKGEFPDNRKKIVIFDTEQAGFHAHKVIKRISELGGDTDRITGYKLRPYAPNTRLGVIQRVIETTYHDTALYIIDGIRDLAQKGINDEETATILTSKLLEWTDKYKIHVIVVLHQNKGDNNPRGHLGTEVMNKAETVAASVKHSKYKESTIVSCEQGRNKEFETFAFEIIDGLPEIIEIPEDETKKQKTDPEDINEAVHSKIIDEIFNKKDQYIRGDLNLAIITQFRAAEIKFGQNKAREFISYYEMNDFIKNIGGINATSKKIYEKGNTL